MATPLPDGLKWCALHNELFPTGDTCSRCASVSDSRIANERSPLDVAQGVLDQYDDAEADKRIPSRILARAVLSQHAEIERLKAGLREALDGWERSDCAWGHRIAELRKLVES